MVGCGTLAVVFTSEEMSSDLCGVSVTFSCRPKEDICAVSVVLLFSSAIASQKALCVMKLSRLREIYYCYLIYIYFFSSRETCY